MSYHKSNFFSKVKIIIICIIILFCFLIFTKIGHRIWNWNANVFSDNPALFNDVDTVKGEPIAIVGGHIKLPMHHPIAEGIVEHVHDSVYVKVPEIKKEQYSDSIPFKVNNGELWITIYVDGIPIKGIFDTGASGGLSLSNVELAFFKRNGIDVGHLSEGTATGVGGSVNVYIGKLSNIVIGHTTYNNIQVAYRDDADGTYGGNLIGNGIFDKKFAIDYENGYIYFN